MLNTELFIGAVYVAGLLSFFSPCIFPLLPVYIGMLSTSGKKSIIKTLVFVIGLSTSFVLLGFGAGSIGSFLISKTFRIISGVIVIIFGIIQMEIVKIPFFTQFFLLTEKTHNILLISILNYIIEKKIIYLMLNMIKKVGAYKKN